MRPLGVGYLDVPYPGALSPGARLALAAAALLGTAAYAGSFRLAGVDPRLAEAATAVGWAAGVSWLVFGASLLALTAARPSVAAWADVCLRVMGAGMAFLAAAALLNGLTWAVRSSVTAPFAVQAAAHAGLLVASHMVMAAAFWRRARPLGLRPAAAAAAWLLGLDGPFVLFLAASTCPGGHFP